VECNFDIPLGGLHEKQAGATWNLGTNPAFAQGTRKTMKALIEFAGRRTFRMHIDFSQPSGIRNTNP
jgi:hypothetical protein